MDPSRAPPLITSICIQSRVEDKEPGTNYDNNGIRKDEITARRDLVPGRNGKKFLVESESSAAEREEVRAVEDEETEKEEWSDELAQLECHSRSSHSAQCYTEDVYNWMASGGEFFRTCAVIIQRNDR